MTLVVLMMLNNDSRCCTTILLCHQEIFGFLSCPFPSLYKSRHSHSDGGGFFAVYNVGGYFSMLCRFFHFVITSGFRFFENLENQVIKSFQKMVLGSSKKIQ